MALNTFSNLAVIFFVMWLPIFANGTPTETDATATCESGLTVAPVEPKEFIPFRLQEMIKKLYKRNTWAFRLHYENDVPWYTLRVSLGDTTGAVGALKLNEFPGHMQAHSGLPEALQGKGFGTFLYLSLAKILFTQNGSILCSTRSPSDDASAVWANMEGNGWAERTSDGFAQIFCMKRDVIANNFSELIDFVEKRSKEPPLPPTLWQSLFGKVPIE